MNEVNETFEEDTKKSTIGDLYVKIYEMLDVDFSEFGGLSDTFIAALEEEIKQLIRNAIAEVCGISVQDVTDEYIRIAKMKIPTGGMTEDGALWDGVRFLTDEELLKELKPLIERDQKKNINSDGTIEPTYIDVDISENQNVNDVLKALFDNYYKMSDLDLSEEDMEKYYSELVEAAKKYIAKVLDIDVSFIDDFELKVFLRGHMTEELEDDKLMMKMIPFNEDELKVVFHNSLKQSKKNKLNDMFDEEKKNSEEIVENQEHTK